MEQSQIKATNVLHVSVDVVDVQAHCSISVLHVLLKNTFHPLLIPVLMLADAPLGSIQTCSQHPFHGHAQPLVVIDSSTPAQMDSV